MMDLRERRAVNARRLEEGLRRLVDQLSTTSRGRRTWRDGGVTTSRASSGSRWRRCTLPNGLPDSIPALVFTQDAARGAVALAREAVEFVTLRIDRLGQQRETGGH